MLWQETDNSFSADVESFFLDTISFEANRSDLSSGVALMAAKTPLMRLFAPSHAGLKEQSDQSYLRGNDLVGFFNFNDYCAECYWSLHRNGSDRIALETVISLRSTLLTTSTIKISSSVRFESKHVRSGISKRDFVGPGDSWFVFSTHPQDNDTVTMLKSNSGLDFEISLGNMERGVIRRIRLLMTAGQGKLDAQTLNHMDEEFAKSPAPLTT